MKTCNQCKETKEYTEFNKKAANKDGLFNICTICRKENYNKNREKILIQKADYYDRNRNDIMEKARKYRKENAEIISEKKKIYYLKVKPELPKKRSWRWKLVNEGRKTCNKKIVDTIYDSARRITKCLGIPFEVDHIIPLSKGGKHNENNLQILPRVLNQRKWTYIK